MEEMLYTTDVDFPAIYGYTGHAINLPQNLLSLPPSLPKLPSKLDILVVSKELDRDF